MASPPYRYLTTDALTNKVLAWDLPLSGVEFGPTPSRSRMATGSAARLAILCASMSLGLPERP